MATTQLIVVDDFYRNPEAVRGIALEAPYADVRAKNYPGFQSTKCFVSESVKAAFASITGEDLNIDEGSLTFGRFRVMYAESASRLKVHVDGVADWTGIVYLSPEHQCRGGTAFYRHKRTGLVGPPDKEQCQRLGITNAEEFESTVVEPDSLNDDAWERSMFVAMRFNRLVLFRGCQLFHSHTSGWGDSVASGRLTQNFFFNSATTVARSGLYSGAADQSVVVAGGAA